MNVTAPQPTLDETAGLGTELYASRIPPTLRPEDDGKFVVLDVDTDDYEVHEDDYNAIMRLCARRPTGDLWLERAGGHAASGGAGRR